MADVSRLPGPVMDMWEWWFEGACRTKDNRLFFHPEKERGPARRARAAAAVAICATCPVIQECRAHALAVREPYGVWGGLTDYEREDIYRSALTEAPTGRPRGVTPSSGRSGESAHDERLSPEPGSVPVAGRRLSVVETS